MKIEKYELKSGKTKWKFYHYLGINPNTGKKDVIERQGFNSKAEARTVLLRLIKDYEEGQKLKHLNEGKYRFEEVVDLWLMQYEKQVTLVTFSNRESAFRLHIRPLFKDYYIDKIDVQMSQEAVNHWYSTYAEASHLVNLTTKIFNFVINQGYCKDNPMTKIIRPKNTHKEKYEAPFYEREELLAFLAAVKKGESLKAYTIFHVLSFTGLRRGEVFGLQWQNINFKKKTLSVNRTVVFNDKLKNSSFLIQRQKAVNG